MAARVVLLTGEEEALRGRALLELIQAATAEDDFDLETFDAGETSPASWSASAGTAPFLSARRTVVVRHLLRCDDIATAGWAQLPGTALMILVADDEGGDEAKLRKLAAVRTAWEKAVKACGGYTEEFKTNPKELIDSIRQEATRLGKKLSPQAAETLAEMCGGSLSRSLGELEKLVLFVGQRDNVNDHDVRTVVMPSREWNVYKMTDAAIGGDAGEALRQLRILVGSQAKAEDAAHSRILPTLSRQLRLIWQARVVLDAKADPDNPPESVTRLFPDNPNFAKQAPFVKSKSVRTARGVKLDQIAACFRIVSDTDAKLKGMLPSYTAMDSLEQMILQMVQMVRRV